MSASEMMMLEEQLAELREEVERLKKHRESCAENLLKGYETGKAEERAIVLAWLRKWGGDCDDAAETIERGEHRKETS